MEELDIHKLYRQGQSIDNNEQLLQPKNDQRGQENSLPSDQETKHDELSEEELREQNIARSTHVKDSFKTILGSTLRSIYVTTDDKRVRHKGSFHYYIRVYKKKIEYKERAPQRTRKMIYFFDTYELDEAGVLLDETSKRDFFDILENVSQDIETNKAMVFEEKNKLI